MGSALFVLGGGIRNIRSLRFTSGATPFAGVYCQHSRQSPSPHVCFSRGGMPGFEMPTSCSAVWRTTHSATATGINPFRVYTHRASATAAVSVSAANAGLWWHLKIGPRPIPKHHHRPALVTDTDAAASADARCGLGFSRYSPFNRAFIYCSEICTIRSKLHGKISLIRWN